MFQMQQIDDENPGEVSFTFLSIF